MEKKKATDKDGNRDGFTFNFDRKEVEEILTEHLIEKEKEPIPREEVDIDSSLPSNTKIRIRRKRRK